LVPQNKKGGKAATETECVYLTICPMFKYFTLEATKQVYVKIYCRGTYQKCERFKLKERGVNVPDRLLPDGQLMPEGWTKPII